MKKLFTIVLLLAAGAAHAGIAEMAPKIIDNATSTGAHPLPLASAWITGTNQPAPNNWDIAYQMELIDQGHYVLPYTQWAATSRMTPVISDLVTYGLPISFRFNNLLEKTAGTPAARESSPGVYSNFYASPYGPLDSYAEVGDLWVAAWPELSTFTAAYPSPPVVLLLDNNEFGILSPADTTDIRSTGTLTNEQWVDRMVDRYAAMKGAILDDLGGWAANAKFIGYDETPIPFTAGLSADYDPTSTYGYYFPRRAYEGGSWSYYIDDWQPDEPDFTIRSPNANVMNVVWGLDQLSGYQGWWHEIGTWWPWRDSVLSAYYAERGQTYTHDRYKGFTLWGMWIERPRVVRPFYGSTEEWDDENEYGTQYMTVLNAVKDVNDSTTLRDFWAHADLTTSTLAYSGTYNMEHPYRYVGSTRNYLLEVEENALVMNANNHYTHTDVVKIWACALTKGTDILVYAYAPNGDEEDVDINVPGYGRHTMDVAQAGSYAVLDTTGVTNAAPVVDAGPSVEIVRPATSGTTAAIVTDDFLPQDDLISYQWSSASGAVTFAAPTAKNTTITVTGAITDPVTIVLTADDGDLRTSDTTTVIASEDQYADNLTVSDFERAAPVVIAGAKIGAGGYSGFVLLSEESLPTEIWDVETSGPAVRFAANEDGTNAYYSDCILYDAVTSQSLFAVGPRVDMAAATTETLYVFYGNDSPAAMTPEYAYSASIAAFWPMQEAAGTTLYDRTLANYDATISADVTLDVGSGVFPRSYKLDNVPSGTSDQITFGDVTQSAFAGSWIQNIRLNQRTAFNTFNKYGSTAPTRSWYANWSALGDDYQFELVGLGITSMQFSQVNADLNRWLVVSHTYDYSALTLRGYLDATNKATNATLTANGTGITNSTTNIVARVSTQTTYANYGPHWISNRAYSAGEVSTIYNMLSDGDAFALAGTAENTPDPPDAGGWHHMRGPRSPMMRMRRVDR